MRRPEFSASPLVEVKAQERSYARHVSKISKVRSTIEIRNETSSCYDNTLENSRIEKQSTIDKANYLYSLIGNDQMNSDKRISKIGKPKMESSPRKQKPSSNGKDRNYVLSQIDTNVFLTQTAEPKKELSRIFKTKGDTDKNSYSKGKENGQKYIYVENDIDLAKDEAKKRDLKKKNEDELRINAIQQKILAKINTEKLPTTRNKSKKKIKRIKIEEKSDGLSSSYSSFHNIDCEVEPDPEYNRQFLKKNIGNCRNKLNENDQFLVKEVNRSLNRVHEPSVFSNNVFQRNISDKINDKLPIIGFIDNVIKVNQNIDEEEDFFEISQGDNQPIENNIYDLNITIEKNIDDDIRYIENNNEDNTISIKENISEDNNSIENSHDDDKSIENNNEDKTISIKENINEDNNSIENSHDDDKSFENNIYDLNITIEKNIDDDIRYIENNNEDNTISIKENISEDNNPIENSHDDDKSIENNNEDKTISIKENINEDNNSIENSHDDNRSIENNNEDKTISIKENINEDNNSIENSHDDDKSIENSHNDNEPIKNCPNDQIKTTEDSIDDDYKSIDIRRYVRNIAPEYDNEDIKIFRKSINNNKNESIENNSDDINELLKDMKLDFQICTDFNLIDVESIYLESFLPNNIFLHEYKKSDYFLFEKKPFAIDIEFNTEPIQTINNCVCAISSVARYKPQDTRIIDVISINNSRSEKIVVSPTKDKILIRNVDFHEQRIINISENVHNNKTLLKNKEIKISEPVIANKTLLSNQKINETFNRTFSIVSELDDESLSEDRLIQASDKDSTTSKEGFERNHSLSLDNCLFFGLNRSQTISISDNMGSAHGSSYENWSKITDNGNSLNFSKSDNGEIICFEIYEKTENALKNQSRSVPNIDKCISTNEHHTSVEISIPLVESPHSLNKMSIHPSPIKNGSPSKKVYAKSKAPSINIDNNNQKKRSLVMTAEEMRNRFLKSSKIEDRNKSDFRMTQWTPKMELCPDSLDSQSNPMITFSGLANLSHINGLVRQSVSSKPNSNKSSPKSKTNKEISVRFIE